MKKFYYSMIFSPFLNFVRAKNKKDAWKRIKEAWPEYKNLKKVVQFYG